MSTESITKDADESQPVDPESAAGPSGASDAPDPIAALTAERDQLAAEKAELHDRFPCAARPSSKTPASAPRRNASSSPNTPAPKPCAPCAPILDDFERATKTESSDKEFGKGMQMIYQRFYDSLKKLGLEPIISAGQPFDPHVHHAVEMVETNEAPDHTVLDEFQRGYNFKGRLLRPAMVKVAVEPGSKTGSK